MFSGIVESTARITSVQREGGGIRLQVRTPRGWRIKKGASVSVDGMCLTLIAARSSNLTFHVMEETIAKTTAALFAKGRVVNLERPLKLGDEIGGHFVLGHIDTRARVIEIRDRGASRDMTVRIPPAYARLLAEIGSIAINGASLTVSKKKKGAVTVSLIPHTLTHTNLGLLQEGDIVNVEIDVLARYLAALNER